MNTVVNVVVVTWTGDINAVMTVEEVTVVIVSNLIVITFQDAVPVPVRDQCQGNVLIVLIDLPGLIIIVLIPIAIPVMIVTAVPLVLSALIALNAQIVISNVVDLPLLAIKTTKSFIY